MSDRRGFSLLEVVVAMALASVLLGAVWTLFQILTKRQAIELQRAEQNQLLRSLHQRISRDLNNLPALGAAARPAAKPLVDPGLLTDGRLPWPYSVIDAAPALPVQGTILRGDQTSLSLTQYVEPVDWHHPGDEAEADGDARSDREPQSLAPALLQRVVYQLPTWPTEKSDIDPALDEVDSDEVTEEGRFAKEPLQLTRTEFATLDSAVVADDDDANWMSLGSSAESPARDRRDQTNEDLGTESDSAPDQSRTEAVDGIAAAAWAYFDGQRWRSSWDTDLEGRLPPAVRLRWRFRPIATAAEELIDEDYTAANPPDEFSRMPESENLPTDAAFPEPMTEENAAPRWYDVEWIFLVQPQPMIGQTSVGDQRGNLIGKQPFSLAGATRNLPDNAVVCRILAYSSKWGRSNSRRLCFCFVSAWNLQLPHGAYEDVVRSDSSGIGLGNPAAKRVESTCGCVSEVPFLVDGRDAVTQPRSMLELPSLIGQPCRGGNDAS